MWYDVGTISVTNGSTTVTGSGTDFISGVQVGEGLYIGGDLYEIGAIVSGTQLTLSDAYLGSTATGQDYKIIPTQSLVADLSSGVADLISDFADVRDYAGSGKFNDGTASSPAITFTQDQNNGLYRIGSDNYGLSAGGTKQIDISTTDVELNYSGSKKLATTATGVGVTGTVTADGLTVDGSGTVDLVTSSVDALRLKRTNIGGGVRLDMENGDSNTWRLQNDGAETFSLSYSNDDSSYKSFMSIGSGGDVSFYEDTGTTAKMVWDASAESLGIGTASPNNNIQIKTATNGGGLTLQRDSVTEGDYSQLSFAPSTNDTSDVRGWIRGHRGSLSTNTYLTFGTDGSERMRIDSAGNVGIGTASPQTNLVISDTSNPTLRLNNADTVLENGQDVGSIEFYTNDPSAGGVGLQAEIFAVTESTYGTNQDLVGLGFSTSLGGELATERMRIDSSGNVGIGTASPSAPLHINGGSLGSLIIDGTDSMRPSTDDSLITVSGGNATNSGANYSLFGGSHPTLANVHRWRSGGSERARIDSSGNLLVGTTDANPYNNNTGSTADNGFSVGSGAVQVARYNDAPLLLNRSGTDGDIQTYWKSGVKVGSIGNISSNIYIGHADTGLGVSASSDTLYPISVTSGAIRDGGIDLGLSAARFKDLYLSGGVYLGGTGAANKLDDYEEGVWTPTVSSNTSPSTVTHSVQEGYYVKVGKLVTISFDVQLSAWSGGSSFIFIDDLPFVTHEAIGMGSVSMENVSITSTNYGLAPRSGAQNHLIIRYDRDNNTSATVLAGVLSGNERFRGSFSYYTDA